jgi:hypothetical protein
VSTTAEFRRPRRDRGRKRGKQLRDKVLGTTTAGRVSRGVAAGGVLLGVGAIARKSNQKPFVPKADRAPNPYRYRQPGMHEGWGSKRSPVIQRTDWMEKRMYGDAGHAPAKSAAGRSGVPAQKYNDFLQYDRQSAINRQRRKQGFLRLPPARYSNSLDSLATFRRPRRDRGRKRRVGRLLRSSAFAGAGALAAGLAARKVAGKYRLKNTTDLQNALTNKMNASPASVMQRAKQGWFDTPSMKRNVRRGTAAAIGGGALAGGLLGRSVDRKSDRKRRRR